MSLLQNTKLCMQFQQVRLNKLLFYFRYIRSFSYFKRIFNKLFYCFKLSYISIIHLQNSIFFVVLCEFATVNVINLQHSNSQIQIPRNKYSLNIFSGELLNSCKYFPIFITRDYSVLVQCIFRILIMKIHSIYSNCVQYNSCKRLHSRYS